MSIAARANQPVANALAEVASLLEAQGASVFRVQAYQRAADIVRLLPEPVDALLAEGGLAALETLPAIGRALAAAISELVHTGRLGLLDRLRGHVSPEDLFLTLPGIGESLAHRIHDQLGIETLEELELAAHDGRLASVPGFGPRRLAALQGLLSARLSRSTRRRARKRASPDALAVPLDLFREEHGPPNPPVQLLLSVDSEYRRKAKAGQLRKIAPRRFNPGGQAWLPVLHTERGEWSFQAMFSNTARAHQLGRTHDWVVIYYDRDGHEEQGTVVTERRGELSGKRVVRGREVECREYYGTMRKRGASRTGGPKERAPARAREAAARPRPAA
ncbi:MAG TPA: helix-hairpin-helix domain-containing protein [Longimicrobiales bacterium]|nr:helix-hairpin-helix domain-containing protein [Longimicrobiales bacterium]